MSTSTAPGDGWPGSAEGELLSRGAERVPGRPGGRGGQEVPCPSAKAAVGCNEARSVKNPAVNTEHRVKSVCVGVHYCTTE